ncbi:hypothetical protein [Hymenobacter volaticus]|uniref:Uncharacterized protein n=1 Tax=Hymenobacter volaticus TaxID=2932254 RepID=A0ABY4GEQ4_9BACT|nr:hypothetical protein [Hymenobacter volaticus]UOQ69348.1 hypothetical protein MUN86_27005 [Hymenobacter volaticus]
MSACVRDAAFFANGGLTMLQAELAASPAYRPVPGSAYPSPAPPLSRNNQRPKR